MKQRTQIEACGYQNEAYLIVPNKVKTDLYKEAKNQFQ